MAPDELRTVTVVEIENKHSVKLLAYHLNKNVKYIFIGFEDFNFRAEC